MLGWELPPHNCGGLGVACYQMSKALAAHGIAIDFVVPYSAAHPNITHMNIHAASPLPPGYHDLRAYDHGVAPEVEDRMGTNLNRCVGCSAAMASLSGSSLGCIHRTPFMLTTG